MQQSNDQQISMLGLSIWIVAALFFLYEFFLRTFVGTISHQVIGDLHLSIAQFTLIGSAYYFAYGIMQIPVGILTDKYGVKIILFSATLLCTAATFLFSHANSFVFALLSRFFMGLGSSFAFVCLLVVASTWFPRRLFGFFAGSSQFIGTMGPVLAAGPLVSLLSSDHGGWRYALTEVGFIGILLAVLVILMVKNKPRGGEQAVLYLSVDEPLKLKLKRLLKNKQAWVVASYSATVYVSLALMAAIWGTEYLQSRGLSQISAAYMISIAWIAYAVGCLGIGAISDLTRRRKPYLILCALLGVISTSLIVYVPFNQVWVYEILFFMLGLAATGQNIGFAAIAEHTSPEIKATALGLNNAFITLSGAALPLLVSWFINYSSHGHAEHLTSHDFIGGLSAMPILYVLSLLISLFFFKETFCKPQKSVIILRA